MEKNKIFSTRDLYLAATLVSLKFFLTGIDYQVEGNKNMPIGYFKFENTPEIMEAKAKYTQGLLSVEPKLFITNLKSLKSEIVNIYKNPHVNSGD
jgi:hypothetical protein